MRMLSILSRRHLAASTSICLDAGRRCAGLMHAALCHSLPPPANSPAMLSAIRQRSGIAAAAFAGLLPHPLLVLTTSRVHGAARAAAQPQAHAATTAAVDADAQPAARGAASGRFASGRGRNWSPEQQPARDVAGQQRGEASHASEPYLSAGRGGRSGGRGRGVSSRGRGGNADTQRQPGSDRAVSSSSAGYGRAAKGRGGRPFGGLPSAGRHSRIDTPDSEADSDDATGRSRNSHHSHAGTSRSEHSAARSPRIPSGRRSNTPDPQRQPAVDGSHRRAAASAAAAAAATAAAASTSAAAVPDAVPRNAGITGGRWDVNDAALVERTLKDADTLRRKFADQGVCLRQHLTHSLCVKPMVGRLDLPFGSFVWVTWGVCCDSLCPDVEICQLLVPLPGLVTRPVILAMVVPIIIVKCWLKPRI